MLFVFCACSGLFNLVVTTGSRKHVRFLRPILRTITLEVTGVLNGPESQEANSNSSTLLQQRAHERHRNVSDTIKDNATKEPVCRSESWQLTSLLQTTSTTGINVAFKPRIRKNEETWQLCWCFAAPDGSIRWLVIIFSVSLRVMWLSPRPHMNVLYVRRMTLTLGLYNGLMMKRDNLDWTLTLTGVWNHAAV